MKSDREILMEEVCEMNAGSAGSFASITINNAMIRLMAIVDRSGQEVDLDKTMDCLDSIANVASILHGQLKQRAITSDPQDTRTTSSTP